MNKRRWRWALLGVVAIGVVLAVSGWPRIRPTPAPRFTDLDTALAPEKAHGWELSVPPKREGPYRLLRDGPVLARTTSAGLECCIRDVNGAVIEEVKLRGIEGCDQSVVYLETADGRRTMAVLKRTR